MQRKAVILLVAALILTIFGTASQAQDNLLTNPGFEDGFDEIDSTRTVGTGWVPWNAPRDPDAPTFQNTQPGYFPASTSSEEGVFERIRTGDDAQVYFSFFETHDAGLYQQVSVESGTEYRFSIYAYVFSNGGDDLTVSEDPAGVALRVGIDPTGGTDPLAESVIYEEAAIFYDAFRQYSTISTAESNTITVFIRSTVAEPKQYTYIYLDDAVLEITPDGTTEPTEESTEPVVEVTPEVTEPVVEETPEATEPVIVETVEVTEPVVEVTPEVTEPVVEETPEATEPVEATEEPTETPTPTATDTPTETSTPTETNTPTATNTVTNTPTATPTEEPSPTRENTNLVTATTVGQETEEPASTEEPSATEEVTEEPESSALDGFSGQIVHTVTFGDTVFELAQQYDSTVAAIIEANELRASGLIVRGQQLIIPVRDPNQQQQPSGQDPVVIVVTATPTPSPTFTYIVRPGDTLSVIAARFRTSVGTLVQLNRIANPNRIFYGQVLRIPNAQPPVALTPLTYIVQPGDSLYIIAVRFGVSVQDIAEANNITNINRIFRGQTLIIPQ